MLYIRTSTREPPSALQLARLVRRASSVLLLWVFMGCDGNGGSAAPPVAAPSLPPPDPAPDPTPPPPSVAEGTVNGLEVRASAVGAGMFVIEAAAMLPDDTATAAPPSDTATAADGATLQIDSSNSRILLTQAGQTVWDGTLIAIAAYGRAAVPGLELSWNAAAGERIFGLGERFSTFNQAGRFVSQWIEDIPGQDVGRASYYTAPYVFNPDVGYGLFVSDDPEGDFSFNVQADGVNRYRRAASDIEFLLATTDLGLAPGERFAELIRKRVQRIDGLAGVPDWTFGPWISKNSYETQQEAIAAVQGHVDRALPVSAVVLEAWKGKAEEGNWNNFSPERFPDLDAYFDYMNRHGVKTVLWQVPLIFQFDPAFEEAAANGYLVRNANGEVSIRQEWLAGSAHIDFTNPDAVRWWTAQMEDEIRLGVAGFKTDDGEGIGAGDVFWNGERGWELHNRYAALYNQAVFDKLRAENPETLVWSRSGSLGRERSPALWAGDQPAEWSSMDTVLVAGLSAGVSGMPFWSHDIGGYLGDPTPEMYRRWTQFGAWSPFMQYHGVSAREPWLFGDQALENYRLNVELRMNLLPTFVELGRIASETGLPIMRPMFMVFPDDPAFRDDFTQYMLGNDILVAPITSPDLTGREVQFPQGRWIHPVTNAVYETGKRFVPIGQVDAPIFLRQGAQLQVALPAEVPQLRPYAWEPGLPTRTIVVAPDPTR